MIYDFLKNAHCYFAKGSPLAKAVEFVQSFDPARPDGRYEIDGKNIYAIVMSYETKPAEQQITESHKKYIDVQAVISGRERMDVVLASDTLVVDKPYDEAKDAAFYKPPAGYVSLMMQQGIFAILYPQDIHRPSCNIGNPSKVRKIVVKVMLL